ncbi:MAG: hypothetical protein K2X08_07595, partial [Chlamydiales bacterium]|nr:hypothetical protein [Chlamydiales bacterium]
GSIAENHTLRFITQRLLNTIITILEKPVNSQFVQAIKPLLKHLIVVVETQENMSGFSKKILQLSKGLMQEVSLIPKLDMISLLKMTATFSKEFTLPLKEKASQESRPLPNLGLPGFLKQEEQPLMNPGQLISNTPPVIIPYAGEQSKIICPKKKKKDPDPDKEDEEKEKDR